MMVSNRFLSWLWFSSETLLLVVHQTAHFTISPSGVMAWWAFSLPNLGITPPTCMTKRMTFYRAVEPPMVRICIRIPAELLLASDNLAENLGRNRSDLIREVWELGMQKLWAQYTKEHQ
jgi:hypothetical protein